MAVDYSALEFISDNNTDKVVDILTGQITVAAGGGGNTDLPYDKGFLPLPTIKWSTSSDFSVSYDGDTNLSEEISMVVRSNSSIVRLTYDNSTGSSVTIYYKIYIFMPNDVDIQLPALEPSITESLMFLTDLNYSKVLYEGYTGSVDYTYTHNLGYHTQVEAWYERDIDNMWVRWTSNEDYPSPASPTVNTTVNSVSFNDSGAVNHPLNWYIKIYLDEV